MLLLFSGTFSLFKDSTGLFVLAVESHSSVSLKVNALQSILRVLSLLHQPTRGPVFCQSLVFVVLAASVRFSGNRCIAHEGGTLAQRTSIII